MWRRFRVAALSLRIYPDLRLKLMLSIYLQINLRFEVTGQGNNLSPNMNASRAALSATSKLDLIREGILSHICVA